jgi:hypothetical protein
MKKVLKIIFISLLFLTLNNVVYAKSELKIGAILPLSGEHELLGNNVYQSILITIFELKNLNIKIIPLDTKSSKVGAINAFQEGINKKVDLFVGPIFYDTLNEIKNIEGFKEKLFVSYSNKEENIFPNVINFGVNLSSQINSLDKLFKDNEQFIFFGDNSSFTKKVLEKTKKFKSKNTDIIFYKNFSDIGNQTKKITNYDLRNKKHLEEIKKLEKIEDNLDEKLIESMKKHDTNEKVSFNKVFVSSFDDELISSISYFDFYDANYKDVQFITLNLWFDNKYLREPSLENLIFPSINLNGYKELNQKYKKNFGREIYHLETLSFDIIPLVSAVWFSTKENQLKASMFNGSYKGKTGDFTIKENSTERDLILYKIVNKKFKKI